MAFFKTITTGSALALALTGSTALADVTAMDVWDSLSGYWTASGYEISAKTSMSGDTLMITDISGQIGVTVEEETISFTMQMGDFSMKENGDGSVAVLFPNGMPITFSSTDGPDEFMMRMALSHEGMDIVASGNPGALAYDLTADTMNIEFTDLEIEGEKPDAMTALVTLNSVTYSMQSLVGDMNVFPFKSKIGSVDYNFLLIPPNEEGMASLKGGMTGLSYSGEVAMPKDGIDVGDFTAALRAGMRVVGRISHNGSNYDFSFREDSEFMTMNGSSTGGSLNVAMSPEGITYGASGTGIAMQMQVPDLPFPVSLTSDEIGFSLTMPIAKSDTPQDAGLVVRLVGFAPDEAIFNMVDPSGQIPRDPATLIVDLSGKANWLMDITDPEALEELDDMPGEIHALTLNELEVSVAGASLTGAGDFTFDNDDLMTWGGMPAPAGNVSLKLVGGNTLLDKLVAMGLVPEDQVMGVRMMSGMFAKPGDGPDTLISEIEVNADGSVFANGMQLK